MPSYIHQIETTVPEFSYQQQELRERMKEIVKGGEREKRIIHTLYSRSGIETRHSVIDDFRVTGSHKLFFNGQGASPGTKSRNDTYVAEGRKLFVETAQKLVSGSEFTPQDISHLITVSCTGFYAPGPDYDIINSLKLNPGTERYHLGFMGCYAALPALKLADRICRSDAKANVMIISAELCTLHFQASPAVDDILSASVFADGAAGVIVSNRHPAASSFRIEGFASSITEKGSKDMAWSVGDTGFDMILSAYIPEILSKNLENFLYPVLRRFNLEMEDIDLWGIHPGGRAILDKVEATLSLPGETLSASREILADYGNMSSATILFVLKKLLEKESHQTENRTFAMAFGPGITLESALLTRTKS
ncbi:MAG: type III polyketide synthase [Balneolaceae bacterium]